MTLTGQATGQDDNERPTRLRHYRNRQRHHPPVSCTLGRQRADSAGYRIEGMRLQPGSNRPPRDQQHGSRGRGDHTPPWHAPHGRHPLVLDCGPHAGRHLHPPVRSIASGNYPIHRASAMLPLVGTIVSAGPANVPAAHPWPGGCGPATSPPDGAKVSSAGHVYVRAGQRSPAAWADGPLATAL